MAKTKTEKQIGDFGEFIVLEYFEIQYKHNINPFEVIWKLNDNNHQQFLLTKSM